MLGGLAAPAEAQLARSELVRLERERVLSAARQYLREAPVTVTEFPAPRSAGGPHDFYSEGDYWWPDPRSPDSPFVRRDGETNPGNFVAHRDAMRRLSQVAPTLVAAYQITGDTAYARHAVAHLAAWFVNGRTQLVGDAAQLDSMRRFFRETLVPQQMAPDGSFPRELARTKPYGYSLLQLDVMGTLAWVLSTAGADLWAYATPDGRGMRRALAFMYPFIRDKRTWPKPPDVMYYDAWPVRHPALLFGGLALHEPRYVDLWKALPADPTVDEVVRNYPIRQPLLWLSEGAAP